MNNRKSNRKVSRVSIETLTEKKGLIKKQALRYAVQYYTSKNKTFSPKCKGTMDKGGTMQIFQRMLITLLWNEE